MARQLSHVHNEIVRVSLELDTDPRVLTRHQFLNFPGSFTDSGEVVQPPTDVTKHDLEYYGGFTKLRVDAAHTHGVLPNKDMVQSRGVELRNNHYRALERKVASAEYFESRLLSTLQSVFEDNPIKLSSSKKFASTSVSDKSVTLNLLLSDLHFGIDVVDSETLCSRYDWSVASDRLSKYCRVALSHASVARNVRVFLNGDILAGVIHMDDSNIRLLTEQIYGATSILMQFLDRLAEKFLSVEVICTPGNHDRTTYKGSNRAVSQRWDSHTHAVYLALQTAFRANPRLKFSIPMSGFGVVDDGLGGVFVSSHGDTAPEVGNVSKHIDITKLRNNVLNMSEALKKPISVLLIGHWHTPTMQMLPAGQIVIVNGSLIGTDSYSQNAVGAFASVPAQVMFLSSSTNVMYNYNIVQLRDLAKEDKGFIVAPTIKQNGNLIV